MRAAITGDPNKRIRDHMKGAPQVKMIDKVSFSMGVVVITFTEFLIMRSGIISRETLKNLWCNCLLTTVSVLLLIFQNLCERKSHSYYR